MIKVHSQVDLITNSSTTIYSSATKESVKEIRKFINTVLKIAGSPARCGDLFELELVINDEVFESELEELSYNLDEVTEFLTDAEVDIIAKSGYGNYESAIDVLKKAMKKGYTLQYASSDNITKSVQITDKDGKDVDVSALLGSIATWEDYG